MRLSANVSFDSELLHCIAVAVAGQKGSFAILAAFPGVGRFTLGTGSGGGIHSSEKVKRLRRSIRGCSHITSAAGGGGGGMANADHC